MPKKCIPADTVSEQASIEMSTNLADIEASYNTEFGMPMNRSGIHKKDKKKLDAQIEDLQMQLDLARKQKKTDPQQAKTAERLKTELKEWKRRQKELKVNISDAPEIYRINKQIKALLTNHITAWSEMNMFTIDPNSYFSLIRDYIKDNYGPGMLNQRKRGPLTAIQQRLNKIFSKQVKLYEDAQKIGLDSPPLPAWKKDMMDPGLLMIKHDPTGLAYNLVTESRQAPAEIFGIANKHNANIRNAHAALKGWINGSKYLFNVNIPEGGEDFISYETLTRSYANLHDFAYDVMDARTQYIIAKTHDQMDVEDRKAYNKVVKYNIDYKINEGGGIQKLEGGLGEEDHFYYVPIRQDPADHNGKVVWHAYEVPYTKTPGGQDFLLYPRATKKGKEGDTLRKQWDKALGNQARLATYTNAAGKVIQGRMGEGWYTSRVHTDFDGVKKTTFKSGLTVKDEKKFWNYSEFVPIENINNTDHPKSQLFENEMPEAFWNFVESTKNTLQTFFQYTKDKNATTNSVREDILKAAGISPNKRMDREDYNSLVQEALNISGLKANMHIDKEGNLITNNSFFNERMNYVPWMYHDNDHIAGLKKARMGIEADLKQYNSDKNVRQERLKTEELGPEERLELGAQVASLKTKIMNAEEDLEGVKASTDLALGRITDHSTRSLNQVQTVRATQRRKGVMSPFSKDDPTYPGRKEWYGRRSDPQAIPDYIYDTVRQLVHNDLKNELLRVIASVSPAVAEYSIEQVKAAIGHIGVHAGLFGMDYSNTRLAEIVTKAAKKLRGPDYVVTPDMVFRFLAGHNKILTGNLLHLGSTVINHFQFVNAKIEGTQESARMLMELQDTEMEGQNFVELIADKTGVTDVSVGIADALVGLMSTDITIGSGWFAKQDLLFLFLNRFDAVNAMNNSEAWRSFMNAVIERSPGTTESAAINLERVYDGLWDIANGIASGVMDPGDTDLIRRKLHGLVTDSAMKRFVSWGLKGAYLAGIFKRRPDLGKALSFAGSELEMRKLLGAQFNIDAVLSGEVPQEVIDDPNQNEFLHPNAIKYARMMVNNTMFGMSAQFFGPMVRGGFGQWLFKFKTYQINQGRRELIILKNQWDSLSWERRDEIMKEAILFWVPPLLGMDEKATEKLFGRRKVSRTFKKFKDLLWFRVLPTLIWSPLIRIPILTEIFVFTRNRLLGSPYGTGFRATQSGIESVVAATVIKTLMFFAALGGMMPGLGDDDEEEMIYTRWYRWVMPLYLNMGIEWYRTGNPLTAVRAYSQSARRMLTAGADVLQHYGIMEQDRED